MSVQVCHNLSFLQIVAKKRAKFNFRKLSRVGGTECVHRLAINLLQTLSLLANVHTHKRAALRRQRRLCAAEVN